MISFNIPALCSTTFEEVMKAMEAAGVDNIVLDVIREAVGDNAELKNEIEILERREELLYERIGFLKETADEISTRVKGLHGTLNDPTMHIASRAKEARERIM